MKTPPTYNKFKILILVSVFFYLIPHTLFAKEIIWYLAAAMRKPGKEITQKFNAQGKTRVYLITGSSGQLLSKIFFSKKGDLFTPSSTHFFNQSIKKGIVRKSHILLEQAPVIGLSKAGSKKIKCFSDLSKKGVKIALGNPKTMTLGKTYLQIEKKLGKIIAGRIRNNVIVEVININQVVNYLATDTVDAGIIFDSIGRVNQLNYILIPEQFKISAEKAYMIVLKCSKNIKATKQFEKFVFSQKNIFEKHGFHLTDNSTTF